MRCVEFEQQLHQVLDEHADGAPCSEGLPAPLEAHAADCSECRNLVSAYRELFAGLAASVRPLKSDQFVGQIIAAAGTRPPRNDAWRWMSTLATAASIGFALWVVAANRTKTPAPVPLRELQALTPVEAVPMDQNVLIESPSGPMEIVSLQPSQDTRGSARSRLNFDQASVGVVLNLAGLSPVTFSAEVLEAHLAEQPAWMAEMTDSLRPVTETMTGTVNALLRVLPGQPSAEDQDQGARYDRCSRFNRIV